MVSRHLVACLEGSLRVQLWLSHLDLSGKVAAGCCSGSAAAQSWPAARLGAAGSSAVLPNELELPALAELSLEINGLQNANWGMLLQLTALTQLGVSYCVLAALPAELAALPALASLDLQSNYELGAAGEDAWAPAGPVLRTDLSVPGPLALRPAAGGAGSLGATTAKPGDGRSRPGRPSDRRRGRSVAVMQADGSCAAWPL